MEQKFHILIDASGSMGYMTGAGKEHENKYLLPDGSTRTDLVKKILVKSILPKLSFVENIVLTSFRNEATLDKNGNKVVVNNKILEVPNEFSHYVGEYDPNKITNKINSIKNPNPGGTPLFWAISMVIHQKNTDDFNLIVLSDGDANDRENFDEEVLKQITETNKKVKIYFIGIDQNEEAEKKSRNLADKTGGFYVNLGIMNYDESVFDSLLFELNTTITSNALKDSLKIASQVDTVSIPNEIEEKSEKPLKIEKPNSIVEVKTLDEEVKVSNSAVEESKQNDLKTQVDENTKSLKLISSQLDSIIKQISYIGKEKTNEVDEFEVNENEELNKRIGYQCEKHLNSVFANNNWERVNWLNEVNEQSKPYDFEVTVSGINYYIECKGSTNSSKEFFLTKKEWQFYLQNRKNYRLYFVSEINSNSPKIIRIEDLLIAMEESKLIPCSSINRKVKANRILFQIIN